MSKFKVGDKVRILDGSKIKDYTGGLCGSLKRYTGRNSTVIAVMDFVDGRVGYKLYGTNNFTFDFNVGAKLAFERLMNSNKESATVEDMRKSLTSYCFGRSCRDCELKFPTCRCGCGVHFMTKDHDGNYTMSNRDIKAAFNIVFGTGVKEVKRRAKKGDYVKIVKEVEKYGDFSKGDILQIIDNKDGFARYGYDRYDFLCDDEYIVLEGYKPDKHSEQKEPHKFKVGDMVKGNSKSDSRYNITNSDMTRGKITEVSEDGKFIDVEILEHKRECGCVSKYYNLESKYFDLVEESPKLYNGKIIFTEGDSIFKSGHIYEVKDGRMRHELVPTGEPLKDIEDVKDYFTGDWDGDRKRKIGWAAYTLELMEVKED